MAKLTFWVSIVLLVMNIIFGLFNPDIIFLLQSLLIICFIFISHLFIKIKHLKDEFEAFREVTYINLSTHDSEKK